MDNRENLGTVDIRNLLQRRLGDEKAHEVMEYIQTEIDSKVEAGAKEIKAQANAWRDKLKNKFDFF